MSNAALKLQFSQYWVFWPQPLTTLTLFPKTGTNNQGDVFGAAVPCTTCRETPVDAETLSTLSVEMGEKYTSFQIWDRGQGAFPKVGDRLVDDNGIKYRVVRAHTLLYGNVCATTNLQEV